MNAPLRTGKALAAAPMCQPRVIGKRYGGIQGPLFLVAYEGKYFEVGEMTLRLMQRGTPLEEFDLLEIDPDAPNEDY